MSTGTLNFATLNGTTDFVAKSFAGMITWLMPNGSAPLFGLTAMLKSETALQVEHGFFTKTMLLPQVQVGAGGATNVATSITVVSTANIVPGTLLRVEHSKENILVTAVVDSTTLTVARGIGTIAAAAINGNAKCYQIGSAFEEGSTRPLAVQLNPVRVTNLTQIFRKSWALTDTVRAVQVIAGDDNVTESKRDCAAFHAQEIETALFFGQKSTSTRNGQPFRTMDGLESFITTYASGNLTTAGSTTNYTQLETALDVVFNQTTDPKVSNERLLFVGGNAKKVLNNIGRLNGTYQLVQGQTEWGLQFDTFKTTRGTFRVIEHPLFNYTTEWSKMAVAVDLSTFNVAYLNDRKTQEKLYNVNGNVAADNGIDAIGGTLTTELTALVKNPSANAIIYNLTAAAAG